MSTKRPASGPTLVEPIKRYRSDISTIDNDESALVDSSNRRTSTLPSPIVRLQGHEGEVFACNFHPDGEILLSSGADRQINIWSVFDKCVNMMTLDGHNGSVMEAQFSKDGENIFSCSSDKTVAIWDTFTGARLRQLWGHSSFINSVNSTQNGVSMLCSGSDDCTVRIWDERKKESVHTIDANYQVTSTCFNATGDQVIYAGNDDDIAVFDIRMNKVVYKLKGHTNSITGISLSPGGSYMLSNCMDNTVRIWDLNETQLGERCLKTFTGIQHSTEENLLRCTWSKDCSMVAAGSSDCHVYIWDTMTQNLLYKLPGPKGSVNDVDFHPMQSIIATATSDQIVYMGEIKD